MRALKDVRKQEEITRKALAETQAQKQIAARQREVAELRLYRSLIARAQREWNSGNAAEALQALDRCQWDLRDVEHRLLWTQFNSNQTTVQGHQHSVNCVGPSPDGKRVASAGGKTIRVWDVKSGQVSLTLYGHRLEVSSMTWSSDGKLLASGDGVDLNSFQRKPVAGEVKVWSTSSGRLLTTLRGHTDRISGVAFTPDSQRIISSSYDSTLKIWDARNGELLRTISGKLPIISIVLSTDGSTVVSASAMVELESDPFLRMEPFEGKVLPESEEQEEQLRPESPVLWDVKTGKQLLKLEASDHSVDAIAFSPDGARIIGVGTEEQEIDQAPQSDSHSWSGAGTVWDGKTGKKILRFGGTVRAMGSVACSPDGKWIATGGGSGGLFRIPTGEVLVWDASTGRRVRQFLGHQGVVTSVAFTPSSKHIVSGSSDTTVKVWDIGKEQAPTTLTTDTSHVHCLAFSPDGSQFISGCGGVDKKKGGEFGEVQVWSTKTGSLIRSFRGHNGTIECVAYSPDGVHVVTGSRDNTLKLWNVQTGKEPRTFRGHAGTVNAVAFSPDGKHIISGSDDSLVMIWNVSTGKEQRTLKGHAGEVRSLVLSLDGGRIITGGGGQSKVTALYFGEIKVWDFDTGRELRQLKGHTGPGTNLSLSRNGKLLVSTGQDNTVRVWDVQSGQQQQVLHHVPYAQCAGFSPDGQRVITGTGHLFDQKACQIKVWSTSTGVELLSLPARSKHVRCLAFSPDGDRIIGGLDNGKVKVWDTSRTPNRYSLTHPEVAYCLAFSPDGRRIVTGSEDRLAHVWSSASGQKLLTLRGHSQRMRGVYTVAFSPDGERIATGAGGSDLHTRLHTRTTWGEIKVWDAQSGQEQLHIPLSAFYGGGSVRFSPDGQQLITAINDKVQLWDASTGKELKTLEGANSSNVPVKVSKDGSHVVGASRDQVKVWNLKTGKELFSVQGHLARVRCVAFSPDGKWIASGTGKVNRELELYTSGEIRVWDSRTGTEALNVRGHSSAVLSLSFSEDNQRLVSCGGGELKVWSLRTGELLRTIRVAGTVLSPDHKWLGYVNYPMDPRRRGGTAEVRISQLKGVK